MLVSAVVEHLSKDHSRVRNASRIVIVTDGGAKDFKNRRALSYVPLMLAKDKRPVDWLILAEHHGGGPCDARGGLVTQQIDRKHAIETYQASANEDNFSWILWVTSAIGKFENSSRVVIDSVIASHASLRTMVQEFPHMKPLFYWNFTMGEENDTVIASAFAQPDGDERMRLKLTGKLETDATNDSPLLWTVIMKKCHSQLGWIDTSMQIAAGRYEASERDGLCVGMRSKFCPDHKSLIKDHKANCLQEFDDSE